jgi:hypothetical protein
MTPYIEKEKLTAACQAAADSIGVNVNVFKRAIYEDMQAEYDEADIRQWFDDQSYVYSDDDVFTILNTLRDDYDSNMSCWENIEAAYNNHNMHLPCEDDVPEESIQEDPSACQVTFPNCQKCAHADECEAYQHALQTMSELPEDSELAKLFMHDTSDCESFEPASASSSIYTADSIGCEDLIVAIETNEDGSRQAHLYAYGYCTGDGSEPAYRFVEYTFFIVPLDEVLQKGIFGVEAEYAEFIKQYVTDCTEEEMLGLYKHYDDGNCPKPITADQLTADIPDGTYVVQYPEGRRA